MHSLILHAFGPIDETMPKEGESGGGIQISSSTITILLFIAAQTIGAVWWASSANEKLNNVNLNMAAQASAVASQRKEDQAAINREVEDLKKVIAGQTEEINLLKTYNQRTREELAARHILIR